MTRETRKRMTGIRQKIAQRLVEAQSTAAILTTFNEADMTRVMDFRARYQPWRLLTSALPHVNTVHLVFNL